MGCGATTRIIKEPVYCDERVSPFPTYEPITWHDCGPECFGTDRPNLLNYLDFLVALDDWYKSFKTACKKPEVNNESS